MPLGKRKRTGDENAEPDGKKSSIEELNLKMENQQNMIELILEKLEKLEKSEKEEAEAKMKPSFNSITRKMEDLSKIIQEDRVDQKSILEKLENQQKVLEKLEKSDSSGADNKPSFNSVISQGSLIKNVPSTGTPSIGRSFVLKHTFKSVSKSEEDRDYFSEMEDHFGVSWCLGISKKDQHLRTFLYCKKSLENKNWAIDTKLTFRVIGANQQIKTRECAGVFRSATENMKSQAKGWSKFIAWEVLTKNYLVDDKLVVEVHVEILEMSGIYKGNLRRFDETRKAHSDVVMKIKNQKFYISKLFLASHSPYFDSLFLGNFQESNQSEIELSEICPEDFQNYLEVLYGDPAIDDTTLEGILLVADMYDTSIVIGKCAAFLVKESKKSVEKKLQLAIRYNLNEFKKKLISRMSREDIRSVIPGNPEDLDHATMAELLNKSLTFRYTCQTFRGNFFI